MKAVLLACSGLAALIAVTGTANAGGFAVREQSAWGQGMSYAGVAAGGSLSAMFWNPATMTQIAGVQSDSVLTGIFPSSTNNPTGGTLFGLLPGTGNIADDALVPGSYFSYQLNPSLWLGMSVNAPFGLSVGFPDAWAGRDYAANDSHLRTYNAVPSIAYRFSDLISVGVGVQIEYADASLNKGITAAGPAFGNFALDGNGWGYGFTAGITVTPTPTTTIGVGYRSAINQKISGSMRAWSGSSAFLNGVLAATSSNGPVSTTLDLPGVLSIGLKQRVSPQLTLLGTVEWTNWSRIGTAGVFQGSGAPAVVAGKVVTLPFQYDDGWFFSVGAEYQWTDRLTVRGGVGYEKSPITDQVRIPLLPDNDRYWLSIGGTYQLTPKMSFDVAYSHLFVKDTSVNITATSGNPWFDGVSYTGTVDSHIDIISVGLKYRWDNPAPAPVSKLYHK
jgi:long-chain fatty acid transport protein